MTLIRAFVWNVGNLDSDEKGNPQGGRSSERKSTEAESRDGLIHSSDEVSVMEMERRGQIVLRDKRINRKGGIRESSKAVWKREPDLFAHWQMGFRLAAGR